MNRFLALTLLLCGIALLNACRGTQPVPSVSSPPTPSATPGRKRAANPTLPPAPPHPTRTPWSPATVVPAATLLATVTVTVAAPPPFPPSVRVQPWLQIPAQITHLSPAGDGSGRLFVTEKQGRVRIIEGGRLLEAPFLDIRDRVDARASEQGLLSIAFPPDTASSHVFYVYYTGREGDGDSIIARYHSSDDPYRALPDSEEILLRIDQPAANHNGGQLQFGPDGALYIGTGDGGQANDPWDNAENLSVLLGKLLRIDVQVPHGYSIPPDNPFIDQPPARPEIWAYGLRNPWRFTFDPLTGDLIIADVGQNRWEEIDFQPGNSAGGQHYGWDTMEGNHCFEPASNCDSTGITLPIVEYGHDQGCSVTGGAVYRGQAYPSWWGVYFFADFCSGQIWALRSLAGRGWTAAVVAESGINIVSFGVDPSGELTILGLYGEIMRLQDGPTP